MLPRLFVAVDTPDEKDAVALGTSLAALDGVGIKLGLEFFGSLGPAGIAAVKAAAPSTPIFLDLKFHDIPNTVAGVIHSILPLEPTLITLHSSGGPAMMKAAVRQSPCPLRFRCSFTMPIAGCCGSGRRREAWVHTPQASSGDGAHQPGRC